MTNTLITIITTSTALIGGVVGAITTTLSLKSKNKKITAEAEALIASALKTKTEADKIKEDIAENRFKTMQEAIDTFHNKYNELILESSNKSLIIAQQKEDLIVCNIKAERYRKENQDLLKKIPLLEKQIVEMKTRVKELEFIAENNKKKVLYAKKRNNKKTEE